MSTNPFDLNTKADGYGLNSSGLLNYGSNYSGNGLNNIFQNYSGIVPAGFNFTQPVNPNDTGFLGSNSFSNILGIGGLALNGLSGIGSILNGRQQLKLAKQTLANQQNQFNESFNASLKQYNTALADRLRQRAAFETGDQHAYDDEITANSLARGQTGNASSSYLNYQRGANA